MTHQTDETPGQYQTDPWQAGADNLSHCIDDEDLWREVIQVIAKLPPKVRTFTLNHCVFVSVPWGKVLPGRIGLNWFTRRGRDQWLVLLSEDIPQRERPGVIAHEIAHAWLRHDVTEPHDLQAARDIEKTAANLAREWGFKGKGTNPEFATRGI